MVLNQTDMISSELKETIDTQFRIKKLLWIGLTVGLILYFLAVYFITTGKEPNENFSVQTQYVFAGAGFILLVFAIILRKSTFSDSKLKNILLGSSSAVTANKMGSGDTSTRITKYLSRQQIFFIISLGINDSIGILGIGIGFISRDLSKTLPYIVVALLLNVWVYPRKESFLENLKSFGEY